MSGSSGTGSCCLPPSTDAATSGWPLTSGLEFGPHFGAVPCARLHTRLVLHEWQQSRLIDTAELVACELVTNAIAATRACDCLCPVRLRLASDGSRALILVSDSSPDPPRRINAVCDTESGRGLLLVEALSNSWGWYATCEYGTTKTVWAELREGGQHEPSDS
jgi:anti-sigma regulatory factor (Ser/Thr protein kinase)